MRRTIGFPLVAALLLAPSCTPRVVYQACPRPDVLRRYVVNYVDRHGVTMRTDTIWMCGPK